VQWWFRYRAHDYYGQWYSQQKEISDLRNELDEANRTIQLLEMENAILHEMQELGDTEQTANNTNPPNSDEWSSIDWKELHELARASELAMEHELSMRAIGEQPVTTAADLTTKPQQVIVISDDDEDDGHVIVIEPPASPN
jgi:hypothetical protein